MRLAVSVAHLLADVSDAEVRNKVEGYRAEADVVTDAERAFDAWWSRIPEGDRIRMDGFQMWRSWKAGWLSMAREIGQLPFVGPA